MSGSRAYATPFDDLWAALSERLGVAVSATPQPSQQTRIDVDREGPVEPRPIPYRVAGERTLGRLAHPWTLAIYAPTDVEVCELLSALVASVDDLVGPPQGCSDLETLQADTDAPVGRGYDLRGGHVEPRGGDGTAAGYGCDVALTLYTRTRTLIRGSADATPALSVPE